MSGLRGEGSPAPSPQHLPSPLHHKSPAGAPPKPPCRRGEGGVREGENRTCSAGAGAHQQILGKQRKEPPGQNRAKSREKAQLIHSSVLSAASPRAPSCSARSTSEEPVPGEDRALTPNRRHLVTLRAGSPGSVTHDSISRVRTAQKAAESRQPRAIARRTTSLQKKGGTQEHPGGKDTTPQEPAQSSWARCKPQQLSTFPC